MNWLKTNSQVFENFRKRNQEFLNNQIIKGFLDHDEHFKLFLDSINNPTEENKEKLDQVFKMYFFNIRFSSFISSALYFNAINFDKKERLHTSRFPLTVDSTIQEEEGMTFKEMIEDFNSEITPDRVNLHNDITDYISNPDLYEVVSNLSIKQKEVLNLAYLKGLSDTEIAKLLKKSQQSVSKLYKAAMKKIRDYLKMEDKKGE